MPAGRPQARGGCLAIGPLRDGASTARPEPLTPRRVWAPGSDAAGDVAEAFGYLGVLTVDGFDGEPQVRRAVSDFPGEVLDEVVQEVVQFLVRPTGPDPTETDRR